MEPRNRSENPPDDALLASVAIQSAASAEGFDWSHVDGVLDKVDEEVREIRDALAQGDRAHARRELGDLLLVVVNLARFLQANPREELLMATRKFANRYDFLKKQLSAAGKSIELCTAEELEDAWQQVKPDADELFRNGA